MFLDDQIQNRINWLIGSKEKLQKMIDKLPVGRLRLSKNGNSTQLYLKVGEIERYIKAKDISVARPYAQRQYLEKAYAFMDAELKQWLVIQNVIFDKVLHSYESNMPSLRLDLISKLLPSSEQILQQWTCEKFEALNYNEEQKVNETSKGIKVRSKTEKEIANQLEARGIPYRYEASLMVCGTKIFPDFTIMNPRTLQVFYWEHFGMMESEEYRKNMENKVEKYNKAGLSGALIITMEEKETPPRTATITAIIEKYLM